MTLVDYSDSDGETYPSIRGNSSVSPQTKSLKRKRGDRDDESKSHITRPPPALPTNFHNLYASAVRSSTTDDPELHNGRQRQVPHISGNWPSFVYLEWLPSDNDLSCLDSIIRTAAEHLKNAHSVDNPSSQLQSSIRSRLGVRLPLHVSLSSPLVLTTEEKDEFEQDVVNGVHETGLLSFDVSPTDVRWVHNFDRSRYFLILTLGKPPQDELQTLLTKCNSVARKHGLSELYANGKSAAVGIPSISDDKDVVFQPTNNPQDRDKFHISIGWTLTKPELAESHAILGKLKLEELKIHFSSVHLKIGNRISTISLETLGER